MRNNLDHLAPPKFPAWGLGVLVLLVVMSWLPLALIVRSRTVKTERQPVHLFLDMDFQPRYGPQDSQSESLAVRFPDGRAMRPPVPGAVRHDPIEPAAPGVDADDDHFYRGYATDGNLNPIMEAAAGGVSEPRYFDSFPASVTVDKELIARGRERYNIYCSVCHGRAGYGDGPVYKRVQMRMNLDSAAVQGFPEPRNLHAPLVTSMPVGKIYDRITRGFFAVDPNTGKTTYTMWPYAAQISPRDRWAIVAYIRVMQRSQYYPVEKLPDDLKANLPGAPVIKGHPAVAVTGQVKAPFTDADLNDPALVARGEKLFNDIQKNCFNCHQTDPDKPAILGLPLKAPKYMGKFWGEEVEVNIGFNGPLEKVVFDSAYFYESVKNPQAKVVKGAIPAMTIPVPPTDEEIKALAAYVKSLSK